MTHLTLETSIEEKFGPLAIVGEAEDRCAMPGKIVQFDDATFALVDLLRRERGRSFQQLAEEAFRDLLAKHGHPLKLEDQLTQSLETVPAKRRRKGT